MVITVSFNSENNLEEYFFSMLNQNYNNYEILIIDNNSNAMTKEKLNIFGDHEKVNIIYQKENTGFARANNIGMNIAFEKMGFDYCVLINDDITADSGLLSFMVATHQQGENTGIVQPLIMLYDQKDRLNTDGNALHYLGYGFCKNYSHKPVDYQIHQPILSPSGACILLSKDFFRNTGGFNEDFFMYNEDQDLAWRGLLIGYNHYLSSKAVIYHKYSFSKGNYKLYHSEKNRLRMVFQNYERRTLLFLLPILFINELLMLAYSMFHGWLHLKIKGYWILLKDVKKIIKQRTVIQKTRVISDAEIFKNLSPSLTFSAVKSPIIDRLINPLYAWYFRVVRSLL